MARRMEIQVLRKLDQARTQFYHFMAIVIAGMGFFTDAYDLFSISLLTKLLGRIYYHKDDSSSPGTLPRNVAETVTGVALCGTFMGQLFFGFLGDRMGRKRAYGITLILMIVCSIGSGLSFGDSAAGVMATLCFFRFWLGFGIGGDYPLSAAIMSEYANTKTRGAFIAAVFAMQGFGILAAAIVSMIVSAAFNNQYPAPTVRQADYVWRIVLMFGSVPAALTYYWRMKMPETARYTALVERNAKVAAKDMSSVLQMDIEVEQDKLDQISLAPSNNFGLFSKEFARRHGLHLIGTMTTWFFLDIAFYSQNLFQKDIFTTIGRLPKAQEMNAVGEVYKIARVQTLLALCGTIPGYWFTVALVDVIGRIPIQLGGFFFMTVFMLGMAVPYDTLKDNHGGFLVLYGLTFFFANFGPNATTFIIPAEIFPARLRTTCHGISAAAGKAGAIVGAFGFHYVTHGNDPKDSAANYNKYPKGIGLRNSFFVLAACNFCGLLCTFLLPESKRKSLEELTGENMDDDCNDNWAVALVGLNYSSS